MDNVKLDAIIARLCAVPVPETVPAQKPEGRPAPLCRLDKDEAIALAKRAKQVLLAQPMLLELEAPVNVVGDVHGQYVDLLRLFRFKGHPPAANYLFLGDYVDRGDFGLETVFLLLAYKCKYPENFFLLRGNHECASINRIYGFFDECKARYTTVKPYKAINDAFNCLPIAAVVGDKIFCVHGGLSPLVHKLDDICLVERPANVPEEGLLCDFLWADPGPLRGWADNDRGVSFTFGDDVIAGFLKKHKFDLVCRAHQVRLGSTGSRRAVLTPSPSSRSSRTGTSSSARIETWSRSSPLPIIAGSLTTARPS